MRYHGFLAFALVVLAFFFVTASACTSSETTSADDGDESGDDDDNTPDATQCYDAEGDAPFAQYLTPKFPPAYYVEQSSKYFDTLDTYADPESIPNYAPLVARWEWPPWLKLTGFGKPAMIWLDKLLRLYPTEIPERDCRAFDVQPFGRCRVVFYYNDGDPCPIYEEFTFNDRGEITFIEAWSDLPGLLPTDDPNDLWAQGSDVDRLATKIPGLGTPTGLIDLNGDCMKQVAAADPDIAEFVLYAKNPVAFWLLNYLAYGAESFTAGCGW